MELDEHEWEHAVTREQCEVLRNKFLYDCAFRADGYGPLLRPTSAAALLQEARNLLEQACCQDAWEDRFHFYVKALYKIYCAEHDA